MKHFIWTLSGLITMVDVDEPEEDVEVVEDDDYCQLAEGDYEE